MPKQVRRKTTGGPARESDLEASTPLASQSSKSEKLMQEIRRFRRLESEIEQVLAENRAELIESKRISPAGEVKTIAEDEVERGKAYFLQVRVISQDLYVGDLARLFDLLRLACEEILQTEDLSINLPKHVPKSEIRVKFVLKDITAGTAVDLILGLAFVHMAGAGQNQVSLEIGAQFLADYLKRLVNWCAENFRIESDKRSESPIAQIRGMVKDGNFDLVEISVQSLGKNGRPISVVSATMRKDSPISELVASRRSRIFHASDCNMVRTISWSNKVHFSSAEEAKKSGRDPHSRCLHAVGRKAS